MTLYITNTVCKQFFKDPSISLLVIKILFEKKDWVKTLSVHLFVINLMFDWADVNCSKQKNSRNRNWKTSCYSVYIKSCFCEAQTKLATFCTVIPLVQYDLYFIIIFKSLQLSFYHLHIFWYWLAAKINLYIIFRSYNSFVIRSHIYQ